MFRSRFIINCFQVFFRVLFIIIKMYVGDIHIFPSCFDPFIVSRSVSIVHNIVSSNLVLLIDLGVPLWSQ